MATTNTTPLQATKQSAGVTEAQKSSSGSATVSTGLFTAYQITDAQAKAMGYSSAQEYANKYSTNDSLGSYASSFFDGASSAISNIAGSVGGSWSGLTGSLSSIGGSMSSILGTASSVAGIVNTTSNMIGSVAGTLADIIGQGTTIELNTDEDFQKLYSASGSTYSFGTAGINETGMSGTSCFSVTEYMPVKQSFSTTINASNDTTSRDANNLVNIANRVSTLLDRNKASSNAKKRYKIVVTNSGTETAKHLQTLLDEKLEAQKAKQAEYEKLMRELNEKRAKYEIEKAEYDSKADDIKRKKNNNNDSTYWDATETQKASQSEKSTRALTSQSVFSNRSTEYQKNLYKNTIETLESQSLATTIQAQNKIEDTCEDVGKVIDVDAELEYYRLKYKIELAYKNGYLTKVEFDTALAQLYEEWFGEGGKVYRKKAVCSPFIASTNAVLNGSSTVSDNLTMITETTSDAFETNQDIGNTDISDDGESVDTASSTKTEDTQEANLRTMLNEIEALEKLASESQISLGTINSQISQLKSSISKSTTVTTKRVEIEDKNGLLDSLSKVKDISQIVSTVTSASAVNSVTGLISNLSTNLSTENIVNSLRTISAISGDSKIGSITNKVSNTVAGVSNIAKTVKSGYNALTNQIGGLVSASNKVTSTAKSSITSAISGIASKFGGTISAPDAPASDKDAKKIVSGTAQAKKANEDNASGKGDDDKSENSQGSGDKTETKGSETKKQLSDAYKSNMADALKNMNPITKVTMAFELPLPDNIVDTYHADWSFEKPSGLLSKLVAGYKSGGWEGALNAGVGASKELGLNMGAKWLSDLGGSIIGITQQDILDAYHGGMRQTENTKMLAMFKNVEPRKWSFTWILTPRSQEESDQIFNLVKDLKYRVLPSEAKGIIGSGMLDYPALIGMNFRHNGIVLNKYPSAKHCALTKIEAQYSKEVMVDGSPFQVKITMELTETTFLTKNNFAENTGWEDPKDELTMRKNAIIANAEEEQRINRESQEASKTLAKSLSQLASANTAQTKTPDGATTGTKGGKDASASAKADASTGNKTATGTAKGSDATSANNKDTTKKTKG